MSSGTLSESDPFQWIWEGINTPNITRKSVKTCSLIGKKCLKKALAGRMASGWQWHTWEAKQGRNLNKSHLGSIRPHNKPGDTKPVPFALPTACATSWLGSLVKKRAWLKTCLWQVMLIWVLSIFSLPWYFTFLLLSLFCTPGMVLKEQSFMSSTSSACKPLICRKIVNCNLSPEQAFGAFLGGFFVLFWFEVFFVVLLLVLLLVVFLLFVCLFLSCF